MEEISVSFRWHPGFSASQKRKNVVELHQAASQLGYNDLLEVSTKSEEALGRSLSAFNLEVGIAPSQRAPVEVAYQGSKVFELGGPFVDLFTVSPRDAKRDERLRTSGPLVGFAFGGMTFPLTPPSAFYDWLFLRALRDNPPALLEMREFTGFTDIEFNPQKSISCQARSCAIAVALLSRGELRECAKSFKKFVSILSGEKRTSLLVDTSQHELL